MLIQNLTKVIVHIGYSEHAFHTSQIANTYFAQNQINAMLVPFACPKDCYPHVLRALFCNENVTGVLVTLPHRLTTATLVDTLSNKAAKVAGACNVVRRGAKGGLEGAMFDGEGFVRSLKRKGFDPQGKSALVIGCGGMGSAIAAALLEHGIEHLRLYDSDGKKAGALLRRAQRYYLGVEVETANNDAEGMDLVVNATPLGANRNDSLPTHIARISPNAWVGEAILKSEHTPFLRAAFMKGCQVQGGLEMLFEQTPLFLEYLGLSATHADDLRKTFIHHSGLNHSGLKIPEPISR